MNCDAPIHEIDRHPSILKADAGGMERFDFCPECWRQIKDDAYESYWLTRRDQKPKKIRRLTRRERACALRALFESLWEKRESDEDVGPHIFFLSHLLMKWGGLKWVRNQTDAQGGEIVVFEDPASGDSIEVATVAVDDQRAAAMKEEVEAFLKEFAGEEEQSL